MTTLIKCTPLPVSPPTSPRQVSNSHDQNFELQPHVVEAMGLFSSALVLRPHTPRRERVLLSNLEEYDRQRGKAQTQIYRGKIAKVGLKAAKRIGDNEKIINFSKLKKEAGKAAAVHSAKANKFIQTAPPRRSH